MELLDKLNILADASPNMTGLHLQRTGPLRQAGDHQEHHNGGVLPLFSPTDECISLLKVLY